MPSPYPDWDNKYFLPFAHALAWFINGSFLFLSNYIVRPNIKLLNTVLYLLPYCITFYLILSCLKHYKRAGVLWTTAGVVLVFLVMTSLGYLYVYRFLPAGGIMLYATTELRNFFEGAVLGYIQYFCYAMLYFQIQQSYKRKITVGKLNEERLKNQLEHARLKESELKSETDKLYLEHALLRSQTNPHFLHNTLNELYAQAMDYSEPLADNIVKLSKIMRYSMECAELGNDKVPVQRELENLQLLIDINKMRFGNSKCIDYKLEGVISNQLLPPLSIITIVENAFKYGDLKNPAEPLKILITLAPGNIYFYCRNKMRKNILEISSHNIGISNLCKRLDIAFKGNYKLDVVKDEEFYQCELTVTS